MGRIEDRLKEFLSYKLIHILSSLLSQSYRRSDHANLHGLSPIRACKHLGPVWPVDARVGPPVPCAEGGQLRRVRFKIGGRRVNIPPFLKRRLTPSGCSRKPLPKMFLILPGSHVNGPTRPLNQHLVARTNALMRHSLLEDLLRNSRIINFIRKSMMYFRRCSMELLQLRNMKHRLYGR